MKNMLRIRTELCLVLWASIISLAWTFRIASAPRRHSHRSLLHASSSSTATTANAKDQFLSSLDQLDTLNQASFERTQLLNDMIQSKTEVDVKALLMQSKRDKDNKLLLSVKNAGLLESMLPVASGTWKVIYAPHMTTMMSLGGGTLDVQYVLHNNNTTMESHAKCEFPWLLHNPTILSVSGTFGSVSDNVCRVDFDHAWVSTESVIGSIEEVPESLAKSIIDQTGKLLFLEQFSVFPVSFLDEDLIVFDFELLGTRICARKVEVPE